ncbi:TlpA family protein disulfide reductase [Sphingobacterium sp. SG20118]|uniref:TlpA family protein disulfide reductase n=1 Tax=Sphingobacterium sp. SG20118 TaxID=3367156 RepID=UPI0037DFC2CA
MKIENKNLQRFWYYWKIGKFKARYHFYKRTIMFLLCMVYSIITWAQDVNKGNVQKNDILKSLVAGDQIPDTVWDMSFVLHDLKGGEGKTIKFRDLKGKVILFDFWATTCSSCIQGFPKMEELQKKYGKDLAVILVNSKRNRDSPKRLKAVFDNYKRTYNYEMELPSVIDDTIFTQLFAHNTIPTHAWVDREGKLVGVDKSSDDLEKRVKSLIAGKHVDILEMGVTINNDRSNRPLLVDTIGKLSTSIFSRHVPNFLPTQQYAYYTNGHTHFQLGNHSFFSILQYVFPKELSGFSLYQFVFDPELKQGSQLQMSHALKETYWYEMYRADSIGREEVRDLAKTDVMRFFQLEVVRKQELHDVYELKLTPVFSELQSNVGMPFMTVELNEDEVQLNNILLFQFLNLLFPYLDRPILFNEENRMKFNLLLPKGFVNFSLPEKLSFLATKGLLLKPVKKVFEYPYFKKIN